MGEARPALFVSSCLLLLLLPQPLWSSSAASGKPMCREEERSALLGFKNSFFNESHCFYSYGSPGKMMSWKAEEGKAGDCCDWGGVTYDLEDGHVIGLDLSASCLAGRIDSNTSIFFSLVHLQELNLAYNSFDGSLIPSAIGRLMRLTRLNLSSSGFVGLVVPEMMRLSNLSSLDLSANWAMSISGLEDLLQSLNKIEELDLTRVKVLDGRVPRSLGNLTSLRSLVLPGCGLSGEFPDSVFALPRLEFVNLIMNYGLAGRLTGFHGGSRIKSLKLSNTNFTGELPVWLGNLTSLAEIDLSYCGFWGEIPSSMGELTKLKDLNLASNKFYGLVPHSFANLTNLSGLNLFGNRLSGEIPSSLGNLIQLDQLILYDNQLTGEIPSSLIQLSQLSVLALSSNMLTGNVPSWIGNLTSLTYLHLSSNKLQGPLPDSVYRLPNLRYLFLGSNHLNGVARLDVLLELQGLTQIDLSFNAFSSTIIPKPNASVSRVDFLRLDFCNLTEIPQFLKHQQRLFSLSLSNNNISGHLPKWLLQRTWHLDLSSNHIEGTLRIPLNSIGFFLFSNNRLSGEIPSSICELENLLVLDLADNDFTGVLPSCFGNFSSTLWAISLRGNHFSGKLPDFNDEHCVLVGIDLSSNSFEGTLPRSLANCLGLKYVNFGRNKIIDTFPSWLGSLPSLSVLMLHSNRFHGLMKEPRNDSWFPSLKVIKLSENNMGGRLPANYFASWKAMKYFSPDDDQYPEFSVRVIRMTIIDKGIEREFGITLGYFTLVDLSSNNFSGTIPESIGDNLLKLHALNLSNNDLRGPIPQSLAKLKNLEVLDLSRNRLSREIPRVLTQVTSLVIFNVSYNNLSGSIPGGNQFGTFENTSYIGNSELCGPPLTKKCWNPPQSPPIQARNEEEKSSLPIGILWITALVGLAGGLVIGVALEHAFGADVLYWLVRKWRENARSTF